MTPPSEPGQRPGEGRVLGSLRTGNPCLLARNTALAAVLNLCSALGLLPLCPCGN